MERFAINRFRCLSLLIAAVLSPSLALRAQAVEASEDEPTTATIRITFTEFDPERGGDMVATLFQGEEGWLEEEGAIARVTGPVEGDTLELKFEGVPYEDSYAIQAFHDANRNGKLDFRRIIPIPKEGVGVSNNHTRMGPPKYDKAEFPVDRKTIALEIIIRYY